MSELWQKQEHCPNLKNDQMVPILLIGEIAPALLIATSASSHSCLQETQSDSLFSDSIHSRTKPCFLSPPEKSPNSGPNPINPSNTLIPETPHNSQQSVWSSLLQQVLNSLVPLQECCTDGLLSPSIQKC